MSLIGGIITELVNTDRSITSPLLKTKVLASRLKNNELLDWVNKELSGYDYSDTVPSYRKCIATVSGSFINGNYQYHDQPLPTSGLSEQLESMFRDMDFYQSVETLESLTSDKDGKIESPLPAELIAYLSQTIKKNGNPYFQIVQARKWTTVNMIIQILSVIRSKLLDFMLKLEEEFGENVALEELKLKNDIITIIMNTTINNNGDGNINNTGEGAKINATITINKGDKEALKKSLSDNGVDATDVAEIIEIIDTEEPNNENKTFGKRVNAWMAKMINKALDGSWQIGIGAAGGMLAEAIQSYYGMK